ncbi:N4-(beta-N-acetylglucosaminyl)-L-asparaginase [Mucilaginibacter gracilis]|uniref:N4-(Beta-N-acetylglucosaminyl)-L-asparaginase n=1 Tax=Mucilaginibacter gracilis TaxID=423350 RepID=A0A495J2E0_9SPHI|nr:N(4)-(beta-N-acetylglucosaminyl)-L-asparaginase [Mucilaginibacter gracilis]RKR82528.1 N4-(beta-N-acetylglucosaminyl)-L-asparaginase [Mucilaginibacter gracilis]
MYNRRKFIKASAIGASVIAVSKPTFADNVLPTTHAEIGLRPIVISTWDFGIAANQEAWKTLVKGGRALDAVEAGVKIPEADLHNHSVGRAGYPDRDGHVTLDACIMDEFGNCGAVAGMEDIAHPIMVARMVMERTPHVLLVGEGATQFAVENGLKREKLLTPESEQAWHEWLKKNGKYKPVINTENKLYQQNLPGGKNNHDTIGMLAIDSKGNISGACTTSGMAWKLHGRVGDSPIIGAGLYVDNEIGGATSTGVGEEVIRNVGSFLVVELMRQGYTPQDACKEAVNRIIKRKPQTAKDIQVGFLAINKKGEYGAYAIQKGFTFAVCNATQQNLLVNGPSFY